MKSGVLSLEQKNKGPMMNLFAGKLRVLSEHYFLKNKVIRVIGKKMRKILHHLANAIMIHLRPCKDHFRTVKNSDFDTNTSVFFLTLLNYQLALNFIKNDN